MDNSALRAEQQERAADRFYSRKGSREFESEFACGTRDMTAPLDMARRLIFVDPADGLARERILGKSDLLGISYLNLGLMASKPICLVHVINIYGRPEGYGTGFLVGPNMMLTNNHVLYNADVARKSFAEFDFEEDVEGRRKPTRAFDLRPGEVFITDRDLDFTLVSVAPNAADGTPLGDYGVLRMVEETGKVSCGECVSVIGHPEGGLKQCCLRENDVTDIFDNWLQYTTDTQPGSSGSPVFNDQWLVVGLHHAGVPKKDDQGNYIKTDGQVYREDVDDPESLAWVANEGVRISCIFKSLEERSLAEPMAAEALRRLKSQGSSPIGPAVLTTPGAAPLIMPMEIGELSMDHYSSAKGYDPDFIGPDQPLPLPVLAAALRYKVARLKDGGEVLDYNHFSIVMNAERRLAFYTAVNIDGGKLNRIPRKKDKWYFDPRLDKKFQSGPALYAGNPLDRGHLVRRLDPCWGPEAAPAGEDTFHFTNCSPQHGKLNQKDWLEVENYVLDTADTADARISVFTGPVFRDDDMLYRGEYLLPADFWKVVAFTDKDGMLKATAYLRTQKNYLDSLEFFDTEYKTWQVPLAQVEALTGLSFGLDRKADPMARNAGVSSLEGLRRSVRRISSPADLLL